MTAAVVFTADNTPTGIVVRFQDQARRMRKLAAQFAHDLAEVEMEKVTRVETQLEQAAGAAGVDVDDVFVEQAIDGRFHRSECGPGTAVVDGVGESFVFAGHDR